MKLLTRTLSVLVLLAFTLALIIAGNYVTLPTHNATQTHFDTLIVLGCPQPSPTAHPPPNNASASSKVCASTKPESLLTLIMTGGPAHNHFIEAHTMAQLAEIAGRSLFRHPRRRPRPTNTIQNIFYSAQIMHHHHWSSAEIVSSPSHLAARRHSSLNTFDITASPRSPSTGTPTPPTGRPNTTSRTNTSSTTGRSPRAASASAIHGYPSIKVPAKTSCRTMGADSSTFKTES